jgi:hypothetical protein
MGTISSLNCVVIMPFVGKVIRKGAVNVRLKKVPTGSCYLQY